MFVESALFFFIRLKIFERPFEPPENVCKMDKRAVRLC